MSLFIKQLLYEKTINLDKDFTSEKLSDILLESIKNLKSEEN